MSLVPCRDYNAFSMPVTLCRQPGQVYLQWAEPYGQNCVQ